MLFLKIDPNFVGSAVTRENDYGATKVSISSGQQNLMKTYHNEANTSRITKIALKIFLDFFEKSR